MVGVVPSSWLLTALTVFFTRPAPGVRFAHHVFSRSVTQAIRPCGSPLFACNAALLLLLWLPAETACAFINPAVVVHLSAFRVCTYTDKACRLSTDTYDIAGGVS